jgi:hypothetical protein
MTVTSLSPASPPLRLFPVLLLAILVLPGAAATDAIRVVDTRNQPAFDAEAIGRGNSAMRPELADTVWIAYGTRDLSLALAHELVHVLSDSGEHSNEPGNLMRAETSSANARLTGEQCERLRARGQAKALLARRGK